jgi:hypothetical protein
VISFEDCTCVSCKRSKVGAGVSGQEEGRWCGHGHEMYFLACGPSQRSPYPRGSQRNLGPAANVFGLVLTLSFQHGHSHSAFKVVKRIVHRWQLSALVVREIKYRKMVPSEKWKTLIWEHPFKSRDYSKEWTLKVKQSRHTPWRCLGGRGGIAPIHSRPWH